MKPQVALTFRLGKPDNLPSVNDAIAHHQEIAEQLGRVALGKTGKALALSTIERALGSQQPTLVLLTRIQNDFHAHSAVIFDMLSGHQKPDDSSIPRYYRHLKNEIKSWIMIGPLVKIDDHELNQYVLCSNKRPLLDVLRCTRTANMLITKPE